jgi:3',5'-cyclic AMP phosphodiesterase CpdA
MKECNIPYCFFGGDSISSGYIADEETMIAQDKAFDTAMSYIPNGRFCRAVGNHDGYWAVDANNKNYYTDAQNYELFLREESVAQNKHFGGDGTYYYVDDIASKVRWIVLDTNDGTVEAEQIAWLQNTAFSFSESGWVIVFISHQPISNHYHANISNAEAVRTVVANYINGTATNKADVVGWFSGHIHRDRIYTGVAANTTDDSIGAAMPFKQVTITSDHTSIAYDDTTKHTVANDNKSHAIDFVTINKSTKTVNLTRLGIGEDRRYTY